MAIKTNRNNLNTFSKHSKSLIQYGGWFIKHAMKVIVFLKSYLIAYHIIKVYKTLAICVHIWWREEF